MNKLFVFVDIFKIFIVRPVVPDFFFFFLQKVKVINQKNPEKIARSTSLLTSSRLFRLNNIGNNNEEKRLSKTKNSLEALSFVLR